MDNTKIEEIKAMALAVSDTMRTAGSFEKLAALVTSAFALGDWRTSLAFGDATSMAVVSISNGEGTNVLKGPLPYRSLPGLLSVLKSANLLAGQKYIATVDAMMIGGETQAELELMGASTGPDAAIAEFEKNMRELQDAVADQIYEPLKAVAGKL